MYLGFGTSCVCVRAAESLSCKLQSGSGSWEGAISNHTLNMWCINPRFSPTRRSQPARHGFVKLMAQGAAKPWRGHGVGKGLQL